MDKKNKTLFQVDTTGFHNVSMLVDERVVTNNTDSSQHATASEKSVITDNRGCRHIVNINDERVVAAVQSAYEEYMSLLKGIIEDLHLGAINRAESKIVGHEGTLLHINFEIDYIPNGDKMDCDTIVLESIAKVFEVQNISCDYREEKDDSKNTNVINIIFYIKYLIAIMACFCY